MPLPLVFTYGFLPRAVVSGFFIAPYDNRTPGDTKHPCGGEGEKRFSSTTGSCQQQGERLHEGSAPSDKQGLGLIDRHCTGQTPALINKAAEHNKGSNPIVDTPGGCLMPTRKKKIRKEYGNRTKHITQYNYTFTKQGTQWNNTLRKD